MDTFFSIIIPVYNVAPYLRDCLDSVLTQTFTDWEAICVDDGSTDGSGAILDEYAARDPRFRVIHQPNAGVSAARNKALAKAKGVWIAFLDGDDMLHRQMLSILANVAKSSHSDAIRFSFFRNKEQMELFLDENAPYLMYDLTKKESVNNAYRAMGCGPIADTCFRRSVVGLIRFKSYPNGEDCIYDNECFCAIESLVVVKKDLYYYRKREGSATDKNTIKKLESLLNVVKEVHYIHSRGCRFKYIHNVLRKTQARQLYTCVRVVEGLSKEFYIKGQNILINRLRVIYKLNGFFSSRFESLIVLYVLKFPALSWFLVVGLGIKLPFEVKKRLAIVKNLLDRRIDKVVSLKLWPSPKGNRAIR